jgi:RTX calcium-binding nonapeptide repeat (4 copies)
VRPFAFRAALTLFAALMVVALLPTAAEAHTIRGTHHDERLYGTDGRDEIYARSGNDLIYPGHGYDYVDCGRGYDIVVDEDWSNDEFRNCERVVQNRHHHHDRHDWRHGRGW